MNKIKVCHVTSAHKKDDVRIFYKECTYLAKDKKFKVYLVVEGENDYKNDVQIIGIQKDKMTRIKRILRFSKKVYKEALNLDADLYHLHDPELLLYALKLKKAGKKVIFDSHEDMKNQILTKEYIPFNLRVIISKLYEKFESFVCKKIDGVIFPCEINGKHPFEGKAKRTIFIHNYPEMEINEQDKKNNFEVKMCYVGSLSENRGITNLLKAYKLIQNKAPLILAGTFETEEYKCQLENEGLLNNVDYRGQCSREEIKKIYSESAIGISNILNIGQYPQLGTFPTKVFEYMSNGLAVIVSDYEYSRKIIKKYNCGLLVDPDNINSIAEAMKYLINNREVCSNMGSNAKKLLNKKYNFNDDMIVLKQLYLEILKG